MSDLPIVQITTIPKELSVDAVTDFQLWPENGGFVLVLAKRLLGITEGTFGGPPRPQIDAFAAGYLSPSMVKDLARVFSLSIKHYEENFGIIPVPGLPDPTQFSAELKR